MATMTLRPNGNYSVVLACSTGADNSALVDETSSDNDGTYVYALGATGSDYYDHDYGGTGAGVISNVTFYMVARETSNNTKTWVASTLRTNSTNYTGSEQATTTSYTAYTESYNTNPNTSAAWTWAEIAAMKFGVYLRSSSIYYIRCTQVYAVVTYTPAIDHNLLMLGVGA